MKVISDSVLDMINAVYHDKPSIFIGATLQEKLVSHHRAVNEADSNLHTRCAGSKTMKLLKTADYWSARNRITPKRSPDKNQRLVTINEHISC